MALRYTWSGPSGFWDVSLVTRQIRQHFQAKMTISKLTYVYKNPFYEMDKRKTIFFKRTVNPKHCHNNLYSTPLSKSNTVYTFQWQSILQSCHFFVSPAGWKSLIFSLSSVLRFETVHTCTFITRWLGEGIETDFRSTKNQVNIFLCK